MANETQGKNNAFARVICGTLVGGLALGAMVGHIRGRNIGFDSGLKVGKARGYSEAMPVKAEYRTFEGNKTNSIQVYLANGDWKMLIRNPIQAEYGPQGEITRGALGDFITLEEAKKLELQELEKRILSEQDRIQTEMKGKLMTLTRAANEEERKVIEKYSKAIPEAGVQK